MSSCPLVTVVGSLNVDHTVQVSRLPRPGETVTARSRMTSFGGKGANQAVAAARAGGRVRMIGCVGNDDDGARYRRKLAEEGIEMAGVIGTDEAPTGSAFITVDESGENVIVVNPGANHMLGEAHVDEMAAIIDGSVAVLLQLECPLPTVVRVAELARATGASVILNPSPWLDEVREAGIAADVLVVNESEVRCLTGRTAGELLDRGDVVLGEAGCRVMIVTRGGDPTIVISEREGAFEARPPAVSPVDTVGAGDTFAGAFAVASASGRPLREAVRFANAAAALATLKSGAQEAIPRKEEILALAELPAEGC